MSYTNRRFEGGQEANPLRLGPERVHVVTRTIPASSASRTRPHPHTGSFVNRCLRNLCPPVRRRQQSSEEDETAAAVLAAPRQRPAVSPEPVATMPPLASNNHDSATEDDVLFAAIPNVVTTRTTPTAPNHQHHEDNHDAMEREEVVQQRRNSSSDHPEHSFWLSRNMEPALTALASTGSHAGTLTAPPDHGNAMFVKESVGDSCVLPVFCANHLHSYTEEKECRTLFRDICECVQILHCQHAVHRNLHMNQILVHPETHKVSLRGFQHSVLLKRKVDESGNLRYSTRHPFSVKQPSKGKYDWFAFRAPELDKHHHSRHHSSDAEGRNRRHARHGLPVDMWSLGAVLYMLLTGLPPFRGEGSTLKYRKLTAQTAPFDLTPISSMAQDLVSRLLVANPAHRWSIEEVLNHAWFTTTSDKSVVIHDLSLPKSLMKDWGRRHKKRKRRTSSQQQQAVQSPPPIRETEAPPPLAMSISSVTCP